MRKLRGLLIGNYGSGNFGDEVLREYFLRRFPDVLWKVTTRKTREECEVPFLPFGFRSLFRPWWKTYRSYLASDFVLFGGGTLLSDIESLKACLLWGMHALVARVLRKPIVLAFQGIGPFKTWRGESIARVIVRWASYLSVRDGASYERIKTWKKNTGIVQTFDPAILLFNREKIQHSLKKVFIIIPRSNSSDNFFTAITNILIQQHFDEIRILLFQPTNAGEQRVARRIQSIVPHASLHSVTTLLSCGECMADASLCLTQRFHGAILALALGVPFLTLPQHGGDKLATIRRAFEREDALKAVQLAEHGEKDLQRFFEELALHCPHDGH